MDESRYYDPVRGRQNIKDVHFMGGLPSSYQCVTRNRFTFQKDECVTSRNSANGIDLVNSQINEDTFACSGLGQHFGKAVKIKTNSIGHARSLYKKFSKLDLNDGENILRLKDQGFISKIPEHISGIKNAKAMIEAGILMENRDSFGIKSFMRRGSYQRLERSDSLKSINSKKRNNSFTRDKVNDSSDKAPTARKQKSEVSKDTGKEGNTRMMLGAGDESVLVGGEPHRRRVRVRTGSVDNSSKDRNYWLIARNRLVYYIYI